MAIPTVCVLRVYANVYAWVIIRFVCLSDCISFIVYCLYAGDTLDDYDGIEMCDYTQLSVCHS